MSFYCAAGFARAATMTAFSLIMISFGVRRAAERAASGHAAAAAKQRDELAPAAHSITSSARASSVGGTSRPSAFAVLRLITNSTFVDCWLAVAEFESRRHRLRNGKGVGRRLLYLVTSPFRVGASRCRMYSAGYTTTWVDVFAIGRGRSLDALELDLQPSPDWAHPPLAPWNRASPTVPCSSRADPYALAR